jgi:oxalate decarboxylase/phosphoglucose isomerase-like protein (cupin superfamily)
MSAKSHFALAAVFMLLVTVSVTSGVTLLDDSAPQAAQGAELADSDFVFNLAGSPAAAKGAGGEVRVMSAANTKSLRLGAGTANRGGVQVLFTYAPCGFRTPHTHPRGTENFHVLSGHVAAELIREGSGKLISNNVTAGFSGYFGAGQVHFLRNIGCEPAKIIVIFDTPDPGTVDVATVLRFPKDTVQGTLGDYSLKLDEAVLSNVLMQSKMCLKRCGLPTHSMKMYSS